MRLLWPQASVDRVLGGSTLLGLMVVLAWFSPMSPIAVDRADVLLGVSSPEAAVDRYDRIARVNPWAENQRRALLRSALVWSVDLRNPAEARARLMDVVDIEPSRADQAEIWEQIGLLGLALDAPVDAADAFLTAYHLQPDAHAAADRLVRAARAFAVAGNTDRATAAWMQVENISSSHQTLAWISQAELLLASGDVEPALHLYQRTMSDGSDDGLMTIARLGAATCLERLGYLNDALAEMDGADLPSEVLETRQEGIQNRIDAVGVPL